MIERTESVSDESPLKRDEITTPALLLDLAVFEDNISKMSAYARSVGIDLRPHAKTHKCPEIAKRQLDAGAIGISVATIKEAEAMAGAGIRGLLITSELIGAPKISRLVRLLHEAADTMVVVDSAGNLGELSDAASSSGVEINVLVDVDPGLRRTGINGASAIGLAAEILETSGLRLRGVHCYSGSSAHVSGWEARREHSLKAMSAGVETFQRMKRLGMPVDILTGGSTGTYNIDSGIEEMTELQAGSYVFMDIDYRKIGGRSGAIYEDFSPALTVLATVISRNHNDRATVDAGLKAFATDRAFGPQIKSIGGVTYRFGGDEHGLLDLDQPDREIKVGDRLEFFPPHCDPTVNLYDRIYCLRGRQIEAIWPVLGRH